MVSVEGREVGLQGLQGQEQESRPRAWKRRAVVEVKDSGSCPLTGCQAVSAPRLCLGPPRHWRQAAGPAKDPGRQL